MPASLNVLSTSTRIYIYIYIYTHTHTAACTGVIVGQIKYLHAAARYCNACQCPPDALLWHRTGTKYIGASMSVRACARARRRLSPANVCVRARWQVLKQQADSQAIVISPLSLSVIAEEDEVKKIRLKPVDRNQRSLNFAAGLETQASAANTQ